MSKQATNCYKSHKPVTRYRDHDINPFSKKTTGDAPFKKMNDNSRGKYCGNPYTGTGIKPK